MVGSRSSSERRRFGRASWLVCLALSTGWLSGCVTVRPEEKEFLAQPAMTFGAGGEARAQEDHVLSNREGSFGAGSAGGGGCGCN